MHKKVVEFQVRLAVEALWSNRVSKAGKNLTTGRASVGASSAKASHTLMITKDTEYIVPLRSKI